MSGTAFILLAYIGLVNSDPIQSRSKCAIPTQQPHGMGNDMKRVDEQLMEVGSEKTSTIILVTDESFVVVKETIGKQRQDGMCARTFCKPVAGNLIFSNIISGGIQVTCISEEK